MFYVSYVLAELRRRLGRTALTALGLGVGVGLVVTVAALSTGLDRAQSAVLEPLTGLGTDMSVTRPLTIDDGDDGGGAFQGPGAGLSEEEQRRLQEENEGVRLDLGEAGEPGERFSETRFLSTSRLSFPDDEVEEIRGLTGVQAAAGSLTLSATTISGRVPEGGLAVPAPGGGAPSGGGGDVTQPIDVTSMTVTGIDETRPELAAVTPDEIVEGRHLGAADGRDAVLNVAYAQRNGLEVGDEVKVGRRTYTVVGLARSPLGGEASDVVVQLDELQVLADREGRINAVQVRAEDGDAVAGVERAIPRVLEGAEVTTSADLAERVGGSLTDTEELSDRLGLALTVVALGAAALIASLLTLASVTKRVREIGTLRAIGWPRRLVVRQVAGESLAQGALGGLVGAALGVGAAAAIDAIGITLQASVAEEERQGPGGLAFGQGRITSGTTEVALEAPVEPGLLLLAIGLALLGGLVAGAVGGLRAARLRPADALRHLG